MVTFTVKSPELGYRATASQSVNVSLYIISLFKFDFYIVNKKPQKPPPKPPPKKKKKKKTHTQKHTKNTKQNTKKTPNNKQPWNIL